MLNVDYFITIFDPLLEQFRNPGFDILYNFTPLGIVAKVPVNLRDIVIKSLISIIVNMKNRSADVDCKCFFSW